MFDDLAARFSAKARKARNEQIRCAVHSQAEINLATLSDVSLGRVVVSGVRFGGVLLQAKALLQHIMANAAAAIQGRVKSPTWIIIRAILSGSDCCGDHYCPCGANERRPS
jgi:hypothetical protein